MNYQKIHNQIIQQAQERASSKKEAIEILGYSEAHHIVPKCMGGTNDKTNIVHLSAREHFIIHILLTKIYPYEGKLLYACHRLMYDKQGDKLNGKTYNSLKNQINDYRKSQSKETNPNLASKRKGLTKHNCESFAAQSISMKGRTKENHPGVASMVEKILGRTKDEYEYLEKMAEKIRGRTKENHPGVASMAEKKRGQTKENHPGMARISEKLSGRTKENNESVAKGAIKRSETLKGRSKYTHDYIAQNAENRKKLSKEQETLLVQMRDVEHKKLREIHEYVLGLGIEIKFPSINTIIIRRRKELTLHTQLV